MLHCCISDLEPYGRGTRGGIRLGVMRKRIDSFVAWSKTHQGKKLIRYSPSSVITTGVSFSAIWIFYGLKIIPGVIWATLAGNVIATLPSYHLNRLWAWGKRGTERLQERDRPVLVARLRRYRLQPDRCFCARAVVRSHHWSHLMNTALVSFTNVVCFAIFWVLKLLVFNRIFHFDKLKVIDEELVAEEVSAIPDSTPLDPIWTD